MSNFKTYLKWHVDARSNLKKANTTVELLLFTDLCLRSVGLFIDSSKLLIVVLMLFNIFRVIHVLEVFISVIRIDRLDTIQ